MEQGRGLKEEKIWGRGERNDYKPHNYCNQHDYIWLDPYNKNSTNKRAHTCNSEHRVPVSILIIWHCISKGAFIPANTNASLITGYFACPVSLDSIHKSMCVRVRLQVCITFYIRGMRNIKWQRKVLFRMGNYKELQKYHIDCKSKKRKLIGSLLTIRTGRCADSSESMPPWYCYCWCHNNTSWSPESHLFFLNISRVT